MIRNQVKWGAGYNLEALAKLWGTTLVDRLTKRTETLFNSVSKYLESWMSRPNCEMIDIELPTACSLHHTQIISLKPHLLPFVSNLSNTHWINYANLQLNNHFHYDPPSLLINFFRLQFLSFEHFSIHLGIFLHMQQCSPSLLPFFS